MLAYDFNGLTITHARDRSDSYDEWFLQTSLKEPLWSKTSGDTAHPLEAYQFFERVIQEAMGALALDDARVTLVFAFRDMIPEGSEPSHLVRPTELPNIQPDDYLLTGIKVDAPILEQMSEAGRYGILHDIIRYVTDEYPELHMVALPSLSPRRSSTNNGEKRLFYIGEYEVSDTASMYMRGQSFERPVSIHVVFPYDMKRV